MSQMRIIRIKTMLWAVVSCFTLTACQMAGTANTESTQANIADTPSELAGVNISAIQAHMGFLAHDLLEGRDTGARGHEIASLYIANEFAKFGLSPGGDNNTFYQRINFTRTTLDQTSPALHITNDEKTLFDFPNDFVVSPNKKHAFSEASGKVVFAGFGIVDESLGIDDYADLDVTDKIVVVLSGRPLDIASDVGASLASQKHKTKNAVDRGAVGLISIQTPITEKAKPYQTYLSYIQSPRLSWNPPQPPEEEKKNLAALAQLSMSASKKLFAAADVDIEDIYQQIEDAKAPKGFELPFELSLSFRSQHQQISSPNVLGILPGSDPELRDEYVVFTAHSDHIGIAKSVKKDNINNGAMDNAAGTAVLIETARMFSSLPAAPKRSIIFAAVTAEERGLLGADYFVNYPTVDGQLVANVNLDMPLITFEFEDVIAFGSRHSTMGVSVAKAVENADMILTDDPWPELNLFTRSDHYTFVKKGIPAVFLVAGIRSKTEGVEGADVLQTFLNTHYHRPSDDMQQSIVWPAAENFTRVNFEIGLTIANQDQRPAWYSDSYFGKKYGKNLIQRKE